MTAEQNPFTGLSEEESVTLQLQKWVAGISLHNPVLDECCPDYSCCRPQLLMAERTRQLFWEAYNREDQLTMRRILCMGQTLYHNAEYPEGPASVYLTDEDVNYSIH